MAWAAAVSVLLLLGLLAALGWTRRERIREWLRQEIEAELSRALAGEVRVGRLTLRPFGLGANLESVYVAIPADAGPPLVVKVDSGRVALSWEGLASLPAGRLHLRELVLLRPQISLDRGFFERRGPARERTAGSFELRIDRLEVLEGALLYEDRRVPFSTSVSDARVRGEWDRVRGCLTGEAAFAASLQASPFRSALPVRVQGAFRLGARRIDFVRVEAHLPGVEVALDGHATLLDDAGLVAEGSASAELEELAPWLTREFPPLGGRVSSTLRVEAGPLPLRVSGRLQGRDIGFGPLRAAAIEADAEYRAGGLRMSNLIARAYGGQIRGSVGMTFAGRHPFHVDVEGSDLDVESLLDLAGRRLPFSSRTGLTLALDGEPGRRSTWRGEGRAEARGAPGDAGKPVLAGVADFSIVDGRLRVRSPQLSTSSTSLEASMDLDLAAQPIHGSLSLEGTTRDAEATQRDAETILRALGVVLPASLRVPLSGEGGLRARFTLGGPRELDLGLSLQRGSWAGLGFDSGDLDLALRGPLLEIRNLALLTEQGHASASARLRLEPFDVEALSGSARDFEVGPWLSRFVPGVDVSGRLTGTLQVNGSATALRGAGEIALEAGLVAGEPFDRAAADLEVSGGRLTVPALTIRGPAGQVRARIVIDLEDLRTEVAIEAADLSLGELVALRSRDLGLSGRAEVSGTIVRDSRGVRGELRLAGSEWLLRGFPLSDVTGRLGVEPDGVRLDLAPADGAAWKLTANIRRTPEMTVSASLEADQAFVPIRQGSETDSVWALVTGRAQIQGPLERPREIQGNGEIASAEIHLGPVVGRTQSPVALRLQAQALSVERLHVEGRNSDLEATLRYGLWSRGIEMRCTGLLDLGSLAALAPGLRANGQAKLNLSATGTLDAPRWQGSLEVRNGRVRSSAWSETLEKIDVVLRLEQDGARLEEFTALLGGGEVRASGEMTLEGVRPGPYAASLKLANVRLVFPEGFRGVYEGTLNLKGEGLEAMLSGRLRLVRGTYTREFGDVLAPRVRTDVVSEIPGGPTLGLDLDIDAPKDVWLLNDMARVEAAIDLHIGGDQQRPQVTGRIWALEGGTIRMRDTEYRLQSASLDFTDLTRINPYIDVKAETRVREYDIALSVEGTADKFRYEITSNPSLSAQDIIALLTTGNTLEQYPSASSTKGTSYAGDVAADYVAGALTGGLERRLKSALGLERLRIDPIVLQEEKDPTARVTLGKRVSKDLVLVYSADLGTTESQIYRAEWNATRRLRVIVQRDTTGGLGSEVAYSIRPGRRAESASAARRAGVPVQGSAGGQTVTEIVLDGAPASELDELLRLLPLKPGKALERSDLFAAEERIREFYLKSGRLEVRVDSEAVPAEGNDAQVRAIFRIQPGPRVDVRIEGVEHKERRRLERKLETFWRETVPSESLYEEAAAMIREDLQRRGFYTAEVRAEVSRQDVTTSVRLSVEAGQPVRVATVRVLGTRQLPESDVLRVMELRPSSPLSERLLEPDVLERDRQAITAHYQAQGFLRAKVAAPRVHLSVKGDEADVEFQIEEGGRLTISSVEMPEVAAFSREQLLAWAGIHAGEVFSYAGLVAAESAVRTKLDAQGYPDARVVSRVELAADAARVRFELDPGPHKTVEAIAIVGNDRTREKVIRRELGFERGDPLSREALVASQQRLYRLGIFRSVRMEPEPLEGAQQGAQLLRVRVEESNPLLLTLGAGYDTEGGPQASVSVSDSNLGGYGRSVAFQTSASGILRWFQIVAKEPRLFNRPLPALLSLVWQRQEEIGFTSATRSAAVRVEKRFRPGLGNFLRYEYQQVDLSDVEDQLAAQEEKLENVRLGDVGYTIGYDRRDDPFLPTRGGYASAEVRTFAPPFLSESSFVKTFVQGSLTHTFEHRNTLVSALRVGMEFPFGSTDRVPLPERFFAGGDSTLRGFSRDSVGPKTADGVPEGGQALVVFNEEWHFPLWRSVKGELFYDGGNVWSTVGEMSVSDFRHVLGAGVRFETPIGPIRAEYGRKLDRREGETRGQFYLSIGAAF